MTAILSVTFTFFALVLCGYVAARSRLLPLDAVPGLNMFVLYFAQPCMLYRIGSTTPQAQLFDPVVALLWLACACALAGVPARPRFRRPVEPVVDIGEAADLGDEAAKRVALGGGIFRQHEHFHHARLELLRLELL